MCISSDSASLGLSALSSHQCFDAADWVFDQVQIYILSLLLLLGLKNISIYTIY